MTDSTPPPDLSPYQPPAEIDEAENRLMHPEGGEPPKPLPLWGIAAFAVVAGGISVLLALTSGRAWASWILLAFLFSPLLFLALFVLLCLHWYQSQPLLGSRALAWKILMTVFAPPVALLVFVPTCVGSTVIVFAVGRSELLMVIPFTAAYFLSAQAISRWLWWWFAWSRANK